MELSADVWYTCDANAAQTTIDKMIANEIGDRKFKLAESQARLNASSESSAIVFEDGSTLESFSIKAGAADPLYALFFTHDLYTGFLRWAYVPDPNPKADLEEEIKILERILEQKRKELAQHS